MTGPGGTTGGWARTRRRLGVLVAVIAVAAPIPVGLVVAWQVHWLLVVPAYLLGIPAWLCLVSGTWALVRRVLPADEPRRPAVPVLTDGLPLLADEPTVRADETATPSDQPVAADEASTPGGTSIPRIASDLRLPSPRAEGSVRTPTP